MAERKKNILIVGASGEIGRLLPSLLAREVGTDKLGKIYLYGRDPIKLRGYIREFTPQLYLLNSEKKEQIGHIAVPEFVVATKPEDIIDPIDLAFITASVPFPKEKNKGANARGALLAGNALLVNEYLTPLLSSVIKAQQFCPFIINVTNPVNAITAYLCTRLQVECGDLVRPSHLIASGMFLDAYRAKTICARMLGLGDNEIDAITIGEHGQNLVIPADRFMINGRSLAEIRASSEEIAAKLKDFESQVIVEGLEIFSVLGHSPTLSPASEMAIIAKHILENTSITLPIIGYDPREYTFAGNAFELSSEGCKYKGLILTDTERTAYQGAVKKIMADLANINLIVEIATALKDPESSIRILRRKDPKKFIVKFASDSEESPALNQFVSRYAGCGIEKVREKAVEIGHGAISDVIQAMIGPYRGRQ